MKKKTVLLTFILLTITLVGCSHIYEDNKSIETVNGNNIPKISTEVSTEENFEPNIEIGEDVEFQKDEVYDIDLNNDGIAEKILYEIENDSEYEEEGIAHLTINDIDYSNEIELFFPAQVFHIIDVDTIDNYYELLLSSYGPSNDLMSIWYRYDGDKLINIGTTEMIPGEGLTVEKDNSIIIYNRTDILETSFIPVIYTIENNEIKKVQKEGELYLWSSFREELLKSPLDLVVYTERNTTSEKVTIPQNSEFDSNTTDNKEWVNIIYNETEYWLHIINGTLPDNNNAYVYDSIENLFLAD